MFRRRAQSKRRIVQADTTHRTCDRICISSALTAGAGEADPSACPRIPHERREHGCGCCLYGHMRVQV